MSNESKTDNAVNKLKARLLEIEAERYADWIHEKLTYLLFERDTLKKKVEARDDEFKVATGSLFKVNAELRTKIQELQADLDVQREANALLRHELDALKSMMEERPEKCTIDRDANICVGCGDMQPEKPTWQDPRELTQEQRDAMPCVSPNKAGSTVIRRNGSIVVIDCITKRKPMPFEDNYCWRYYERGNSGAGKAYDIIAIVPEGVDIQPDNA